MPEVITDKDLPKLLDTPTKQVRWVKKLIAEHLGSATKQVGRPPMQGMFSRTFFVALADGREGVVQFRTEPLDVSAFKTAKGALGPFVPDAEALGSEELESAGVWAYWLTRMPGQMWKHGVAGKGAEGRIAINKSLGRVFSRGFLVENSREAVETRLRPHLDALLASPLEEILPYRATLESFAKRLDEFAQLPLWVAHYDLNDVNVLIDENCEVTALIDWELSTPLPLGAGFGRIHTIAGEYTGGEFWMPEEFEVAERGFWTELFGGIPEHIRTLLEKHIDLVQDVVILATLLNCFIFEHGSVIVSQVALKALPKFMTYRIPLVRVQDQPYSA
jgi:aminoglycoside phosphotransferase (APT) family kinase protein